MKAQSSSVDQQGMISMLTVILLGLILTVITTGFLSVVTRNQRQANEAKLNTQAFYAVETGIEDAKHAIDLRLNDIQNGTSTVNLDPGSPDGDNNDCRPAETTAIGSELQAGQNRNILDAQGVVSYTCQLIDMHPNKLAYDRDAYNPVLLNLEPAPGASGFDQVEITWRKRDGDNTVYSSVDPADAAKLKNQADMAGIMPMLRIELMSVTNNDNGTFITRDQFYRNERSYFVSPVNNGSGVIPVTFCSFTDSTSGNTCSLDSQFNNAVQTADCDPSPIPSEGDVCKVVLKLYQPVDGVGKDSMSINGTTPQVLDANYVTKLRLRSIYHAAHMEVRLLNSGSPGTALPTNGAQATIDVTGKANDVFRRLKVHVPLENNTFPFPDYTIQTAENLCKLFKNDGAAVTVEPECTNDW